MKNEPEKHDYFAELYVAGMLADYGWNVYFPHRDKGFDFIISKEIESQGRKELLIRPVQVKGKFPTQEKGNKQTFGYVGELSPMHQEMVLAIPFFSAGNKTKPIFVAFMPYSQIKNHCRGYHCEPASFKDGEAKPRRDFKKFFDIEGILLMENLRWKDLKVD